MADPRGEADDELPLDPDAIRAEFREWWTGREGDEQVAFEAFEEAAHRYKTPTPVNARAVALQCARAIRSQRLGDTPSDRVYTHAADLCEALAATLPDAPQPAPSFETVRDAIAVRMGGHTISERDGDAWGTFLVLLRMVKASECALPATQRSEPDAPLVTEIEEFRREHYIEAHPDGKPGLAEWAIQHNRVLNYLCYRACTPLSEKQQICEWLCDEDGIWHTGCGNEFVFTEAGPRENKTKFCQYCGEHLSTERQFGNSPAETAPSGTAKVTNGLWSANDPRHAFVMGMRWWQFKANGATAFPSEIDQAEAEAMRRYGNEEKP